MTPDPTRKLADLAKAEADALGHGAISTEHFLLALATDPSCGAMTLLSRFGATADAIRAAVIALAPSGHAESRARLPFTPDAKRVLEAALNAATALAAQRIESTHVLLGLTSNPEFTSARALTAMGIDLAKVREAVLRG